MILNMTAKEIRTYKCPFYFDIKVLAEWYVPGEGYYTMFDYFGFKSRDQAKLFALSVIDNELGATCIPSDVIKAFKTIFLKTKEIVIPDRFTLSIEEIPFSEEP